MIVKCQTFKTTTFYKSATQRHGYLEREGRAVGGVTTQNVIDNDRWYAEMDKTTERYRLRGCVIGREFVLSPSPDDGATPEQMRGFAHEWLQRNFPNAEAAVVIHEDNKERGDKGLEPIPHAHAYVNAPDLETGKKIVLDNRKVRELHDTAQDMSRARGWSEQEKYFDLDTGKVRTIKSRRPERDRRPKWQRLQERANPDYDASKAKKSGISRHEYEQAKAGRGFEKTEVRRALKEAIKEAGGDPGTTLKTALAKRGVEISVASDGDYKYRLAGKRFSFKGATLGASYSKGAVKAALSVARSLANEAEKDMSR